jgi:hypothetical protein
MVDTATASVFSTLTLQAIIGVIVYVLFESFRGKQSLLFLLLPLSVIFNPSQDNAKFMHRDFAQNRIVVLLPHLQESLGGSCQFILYLMRKLFELLA